MKEKEQSFEDALKKLEAIVENLESGELSLSDAIKKYEEGMKLSQFCTKKLHEIQKKIEVLVKDPSGNLSAKDFVAEDYRENKSSKPQQEEKGKKGKKAEELLF